MVEGSSDCATQKIDFATASPEVRSVLGIDLNELFLSARTKNVLQLAGIRFMGELVPLNKATVASLQNCGAKTVTELQDILDAFGLKFGTDVVGWTAPEIPSPADVPSLDKTALSAKRLGDYDPQTRARLRIRLSELDFSRRASNIFGRQDMQYVGDLVQRREIDLLRTNGCGRTTVAEISEKLGKLGLSLGTVVSDWDPQIAETEREAEERQQKAALVEARNVFSTLPKAECLEDELLGILGTAVKDRNFDATANLFGWTGAGQRTLESVGQEYGVTRERIRQIAARAIPKIRGGFETPWLDKALNVARNACPAMPKDIAKKLRAEGVSRAKFDPTGLLTACEMFDKKPGFVRTMIGQEVVYEEKKLEGNARELLRLCKRLTASNGCANFDSVCSEAGIPEEKRDTYRRIVEINDFCVWLDENRSWLMATGLSRNRLSNLAAKVLHVAPKVNLSELRRAVSKSHRLASVPPLSVLARFLEKIGLARVEGSKVIALSTFPNAIEPGGAEETIIEVLKANGPAVSIEKFQELCVSAGMNPVTVGIYSSNSPVVSRLARGVYGLVGADVAPGVVEEIGEQLSASRKPAEWGWSTKGALWCAIHLNRVCLSQGSVSIPRFVADYAEGQWQPEIACRELDATVKCRDNFLWGLKRPLVNAGAEPGDVCVLEFERSTRKVRITVGGEELIDLWESGDIDAAASAVLDSEAPEYEDDPSETTNT
ncbi:MAG: hypothetical protein FJ311_05035 [Rhodospirillales bacterium]|nr:hypothetical protein [Rhodospirillales bacterium]